MHVVYDYFLFRCYVPLYVCVLIVVRLQCILFITSLVIDGSRGCSFL